MNSKKLLSLFMAVLLVLGAASFTASADEQRTLLTVDFCEDIASAPFIETGVCYTATVPGAEYWRKDAVVRIKTEDVDGYYYLLALNENDVDREGEIRIQLTDADNEEIMFLSLGSGEEQAVGARLKANTEYYLSVVNLWDGDPGRLMFNLWMEAADPEPNEKKGKVLVPSNEFYEGNLANADDVDWICLGDYDQKQYRVLLESREEGQQLQAEVHFYSGYKDTFSLTHGETSDAAIISRSGKNERYYVKITGLEGSYGNYAVRLEDVTTITPENDRTFNSVKFMPVFTNSEYDRTYIDADPVIFGRTCVCSIPEGTSANSYNCVKISTEDLKGDFEIRLKNDGVSTDGGLLAIQVREGSRNSDDILIDTALEMGEEQSYTLSLTKNNFYYICFYTLDENTRPGGLVNFCVSEVKEPEETETTLTTETTEATEVTTATESTESTAAEITTEAVEVTTEITEPSEAVTTATTEPAETTTVTVATEPETESSEATEITTEAKTETTAPSVQFLLGDTDLSGKINIKDATLIQKAIAKLTKLDETQNKVADVTADTKVNIKDATAIQKYIAKIEIPYSIGEYIK